LDYKLPISVKGIILKENKVILLRNERNEWELPGGRLEHGETLEKALTREINEELGIYCSIDKLNDVWVYEVYQDREVLIITFICNSADSSNVVISNEHLEYKWFPVSELESLNMPQGYKDSIRRATS